MLDSNVTSLSLLATGQTLPRTVFGKSFYEHNMSHFLLRSRNILWLLVTVNVVHCTVRPSCQIIQK
jgi:hypothetical protein